VKLVIVGGSAFSTPALLGDDTFARIPGLSVTLIGRDAERLSAVRRAGELLSRSVGRSPSCSVATLAELDSALDGADVVLVQSRVGGYRARAYDERFPLEFGICGDEGLGPGGLAAAVRTWPHLSGVLGAVARRSPAAIVLLMSAPLGLLARCSRAAFASLHVVGLCELPWTTLSGACAAAGVDGRHAEFSYVGVNHLGWLYAVAGEGCDVVAHYANARDGDAFPHATLVRELGAIPLGYLRLHYAGETELRRQAAGPPRAEELASFAGVGFRAYRTGDATAIRAALERRPTPWYRDAVAPLLAALATGCNSSVPFFLTTANEDYVPFLSSDDVVERPYDVVDGSLVPRPLAHGPPAQIAATLSDYVFYERASAPAVMKPTRASVARALAKHPWLAGRSVPEALVDAILVDVTAPSAGAA
jgi:6-phospho-beta-glucosidase